MRAIFLVARREYLAYITAWGFWLGLILTPLILVVSGFLPGAIAKSQPIRYYTVVDDRPDFADALFREIETARADLAKVRLAAALSDKPKDEREAVLNRFAQARLSGLDTAAALSQAGAAESIEIPAERYIHVDPPGRTPEALAPYLFGVAKLSGKAGDRPLFAALVISRDAASKITDVGYWSDDVVDSSLSSAAEDALHSMSRASVLKSAGLDPAAVERADLDLPAVVARKAGRGGKAAEVSNADRAPFFAASAISFLLWLLVFSVVNFLLMGTLEERSNKIFDSLLTSVRLGELLAGKLIGVLALAATLMAAWALFATALIVRSGDSAVLTFAAAALNPELVTVGLVGFLAGYVMYAAVFLALGSLCDTIQEAQTLVSPLYIFLMAPLFTVAIAIRQPASPVVEALSWFPPFSPFLMILRAPLHPPLWETLAQTVLMAGFAGLALFVSIRVYRAGAVNGAGVSQVFGWLGRKKKA